MTEDLAVARFDTFKGGEIFVINFE